MTEYVKRGDAIVRVEPAGGVSGMLLRDIDGGYFFRVYNAHESFTDYDLYHDDLAVTIAPDAFASFYHRGEEQWLDHTPSVLGIPLVNADGSPADTAR